MKDIKSFINESICCTGNCGNDYNTQASTPYCMPGVDSICRDFNNYFSMCNLNCMKVEEGLYVVTGSQLRHTLQVPVAGYISLDEWADRVGLCIHTLWPDFDNDYDDDHLSSDALAQCRAAVKDNDYIILADPSWHEHDDE